MVEVEEDEEEGHVFFLHSERASLSVMMLKK